MSSSGQAASVNGPPVYQLLSDGLLLRQATPDDSEKLIEFNRLLLGNGVAEEVAFLLSGQPQPNFSPADCLVVVDKEDAIVSSVCFIEVEWQLGQTRLRLGQPEYVGTLPQYRGRGLVRQQFKILEGWLRERGLAFGFIGGIPYYYRLFGYEYAVDIPRVGYLTPARHTSLVPMPSGIEVRPVRESDAPALLALDARRNAEVDLSNEVSEVSWRWFARTFRLETHDVEAWIALKDGQPVGSARLQRGAEVVVVSNFTGDLMAAQALIAQALTLPGLGQLKIGATPRSEIGRWLATMQPYPAFSYAWYVRVNDPRLAFEQFGPEFERRLAASPFAGLSRELDLGFYRLGLRLVFEGGKLRGLEALPALQEPKNAIPPDLLPKLLMGYRELDQLAELHPDLSASDDWELLKVLFPRLEPNIRFFMYK